MTVHRGKHEHGVSGISRGNQGLYDFACAVWNRHAYIDEIGVHCLLLVHL